MVSGRRKDAMPTIEELTSDDPRDKDFPPGSYWGLAISLLGLEEAQRAAMEDYHRRRCVDCDRGIKHTHGGAR